MSEEKSLEDRLAVRLGELSGGLYRLHKRVKKLEGRGKEGASVERLERGEGASEEFFQVLRKRAKARARKWNPFPISAIVGINATILALKEMEAEGLETTW